MRLSDSMIVDKAKLVSAVGGCLGSILLLVAVYLLFNRLVFLAHATSSSAPIVAVSHEYVAQGKGSVLAYVPTVQISGEGRTLNLKVDMFNEEPVYIVGQQMQVVCNVERGCIQDTLFKKWGACLIDLLLSLVFFSPLIARRFGLWQPNGEITGLNLPRDA
jgi:hypothetical protein